MSSGRYATRTAPYALVGPGPGPPPPRRQIAALYETLSLQTFSPIF